jgi:hypothetical protein
MNLPATVTIASIKIGAYSHLAPILAFLAPLATLKKLMLHSGHHITPPTAQGSIQVT